MLISSNNHNINTVSIYLYSLFWAKIILHLILKKNLFQVEQQRWTFWSYDEIKITKNPSKLASAFLEIDMKRSKSNLQKCAPLVFISIFPQQFKKGPCSVLFWREMATKLPQRKFGLFWNENQPLEKNNFWFAQKTFLLFLFQERNLMSVSGSL